MSFGNDSVIDGFLSFHTFENMMLKVMRGPGGQSDKTMDAARTPSRSGGRKAPYENGAVAKVERFTGVATIVLKPPTTPASLRKNPLGLFVHSINWSRDLIGDAK